LGYDPASSACISASWRFRRRLFDYCQKFVAGDAPPDRSADGHRAALRRFPQPFGDRIVFVANGNVWSVPKSGGTAVGHWWLCLPVEHAIAQVPAPKTEVGVDLGLKDTAVTSEGARLEAGHFYRSIEQKIASAQRRGHKRQAKRLHRTAARRRKDALHKFSRKIVNQYQRIVVGDVSSLKLAKTRMAKSVLDAGWGLLKTYLHYKGQQAGRCVQIVSERNTRPSAGTSHRLQSRSRARHTVDARQGSPR
jgi:IS605 OrfB family transposase